MAGESGGGFLTGLMGIGKSIATNIIIGGLINMLTPATRIEGPRADLSRPQTADPGIAIPEVDGDGPCVGHLLHVCTYPDGKKVKEVKVKKSSGGFLTPKTETVTYRYFRTYAVGICRTDHLPTGRIKGIVRAWRNDVLVADFADVTTMAEQAFQLAWRGQFIKSGLASSREVFTGEETQQPSATLESFEGAGNVPAYRGWAYVVFKNEEVTKEGGAIPRWRFEIAVDGADGSTTTSVYAPQHLEDALSSDGDVWELWGVGSDPLIINHTQRGTLYASASAAIAAQSDRGTAPVGGLRENNTEFWNSIQALPDDFRYTVKDVIYCYLPSALVELLNDSGSGISAQTADWPNFHYSDLLLDVYSPADLYPSPVFGCSTDWVGNVVLKLHESVTPPAPDAAILQLHSTAGHFKIWAYQPTILRRHNTLTCNFSCPLGDPVRMGEPTTIPESPSFCVDRNGTVTPNGSYEVATTGSYKQLAISAMEDLEDYASMGLNILYPVETQIPVGPVLHSSDPNYSNGAFWSAAARAAGVPGSYGVDFPVTRTASQVCTASASIETLDSTAILLKDLITRDCERVGIDSTLLEFVGLDAFTVHGRSVLDVNAPADRLAEMQTVFQIDTVAIDAKLKFIRRAAVTPVAIPWAEFGAIVPGSEFTAPLLVVRPNEPELPRETHLLYFDVENSTAQGKQTARRDVVASLGERKISTSFSLTQSEAFTTVNIVHQAQWSQLYGRVSFSLGDAWSHIVPGDWITTDDGSRAWSIRITRQNVQGNGLVSYEGVVDRLANYDGVSVGVATGGGQTITPPGLVGPTVLRLLNLPNLVDADDRPGFYVAVGGVFEAWPGCELQSSSDGGTTFLTFETITDDAVIGTAYSALAAGQDKYPTDDYVDVLIQSWQTLTGTDETGLFNGVKRVLIGDEIMHYRDVADQGSGVWRLSRLLRGQRATDPIAHAMGSAVVLLDEGGIVFVPFAGIGVEVVMRAITLGTPDDDQGSQEFTCTGESVDAFPVENVLGVRNSGTTGNDLTVTFIGRHRLGSGFQTRPSPYWLRYEMDILSAGTSVRTLTSTSETFTYSEADQTTDFGSVQSSIDVEIYAVNSYGRGDVYEATL